MELRCMPMIPVNERLYLLYNESEVLVTERGEILRQAAFRYGLAYLRRIVFLISECAAVHSYYDARAYLSFSSQTCQCFVHTPFLTVPGYGSIEQVLSVMHIDYVVFLLRVVVRRCPYPYCSGRNEFRLEVFVDIDFSCHFRCTAAGTGEAVKCR